MFYEVTKYNKIKSIFKINILNLIYKKKNHSILLI